MNTYSLDKDFSFFIRLLLIIMALGIILGAIGAHALTSALPAEKIASFKTGVLYHLIAALSGLLLISLRSYFTDLWLKRVLRMLLFGILFFSGSIYLLALNHIWQISRLKWLGPITPIGGLLLILSFLLLSFGIKQKD